MIAVEATMQLEAAGLRMRIDGSGSILTCRLDTGAASLFATLRRSRYLLHVLRALVPVLLRCGLRLDFIVGSMLVGSVGSGVNGNAPARFLRLPATRIGM